MRIKTMRSSTLEKITTEESAQAVTRMSLGVIAVFIIIAITTIDNNGLPDYALFLLAYPVFIISTWCYIKVRPGNYPNRRRAMMVADSIVVVYPIHLMDQWGAIFFFLIIWVIVNNGLRFGPQSLIETAIVTIVGFITVVWNTPYWMENLPMSSGMLIGIIILPAFFLYLITCLTKVSNELEDHLELASYAATHDELSGLSNRVYFYQALEDKIHDAKRGNLKFYILFIDLDGFKKVNDDYGHDYGDAVIIDVAQKLEIHVRESDAVARLGGDEFAILLSNIKEGFDIAGFTSRLINSISVPLRIKDKELVVSASIGVCAYPFDGVALDDLINASDSAMYESKNKGKNQFTLSKGVANG